MFLHNWEMNSYDTLMTFKKGKFKVEVKPKSRLLNEPVFEISVYDTEVKIDKPFFDLNTAIYWCEARL